jgi:hypothetical protein
MSFIKQAYESLIKEAISPEHVYVTLYEDIPFYGGPEEGGWWGSDCVLVESMHFNYREEADKVKVKVDVFAKELSVVQKRLFGERCLAELDWLDARGLDSDFLPEVDGESKYFVVVEDDRGSLQRTGDRGYS